MFSVILMVIFGFALLGGIFLAVMSKQNQYGENVSKLVGIGGVVVGAVGLIVTLLIGTWVSNDVNKAQLFVDQINRQIVGQPITTPVGGPFLKSPFVDTVEFDLRQQELIYAGAPNQKPAWVGERNLDGSEITVQVGGASANLDATVNYQILPSQIVDIYSQYGSQQAFEIQVVKDQALSTMRQIPSSYTTNEFRGTKKGEAEQKMTDGIQTRLAQYVTGVAVSIQEIRYPGDIETQLQEVEKAKQEVEKAKASQERQRIENATTVEKAKADAQANELVSKSLTPEVLEARRIEALKEAQTIYVPYNPTIVAK